MKIIVVGATGYTGKLVCKQLDKENIHFDITGRDMTGLLLLKEKYKSIDNIVIADVMDKKGVDEILNSDIIINCVGPFYIYANLLLEAVVKQSKIYFDISGEELFVDNSIEKFAETSKSNGAVLVHSAAFESALVEVMVNLLMQNSRGVESVNSYYRFEQSKPSPGTRFTMKLSRFIETFIIKNGEKIKTNNIANDIGSSFEVNGSQYYPIHYPMPEIPLLAYKFGIKNIASFLLVDKLSASVSKNAIGNKSEMADVIRRFIKRKSKGPTEMQRENQYFDLIVDVKYDNDTNKQMRLSGKDMYMITAKIISYLVRTILKSSIKFKGIVTPYELIKGEEKEFFEYLGVDVY